jgi:hypothetical protein
MKTPEILTWVFFGSEGITDSVDLMRAMILCCEICRQGDSATVETIKETSGFKGAYYDLPKRLLTDEKIQEMIEWSL